MKYNSSNDIKHTVPVRDLQSTSVICGNKDFWQVTYLNNDFSNKIACPVTNQTHILSYFKTTNTKENSTHVRKFTYILDVSALET